MIQLLNGCYRGKFSVTPKNWDSNKASTAKNWRIHFRFYDPSTASKEKGISVRGMNSTHDLKGRQELTRTLMERMRELYDEEGFNPITGLFMREAAPGEINEMTHFIPALEGALKMLKVVPAFKLTIESAIRKMKKAAEKLFDNTLQRQYCDLRISQVRRKHLIYLLDQCRADNPKHSDYTNNKYRSYLLMLFKRLLIVEAVDSNPAKDLPIEKYVSRKRELLTLSERMIIDTNLKTADYYYWRYVRIFFRSACRHTELLSLKNDKVNLESQEFTVLVKKGKNYREHTRVIPDDVIMFWREVLDETGAGEYLFSTAFKPGPKRIGNDNPTKRWGKLVKDKMGIQKDLNSLRNLNADILDEQRGIQFAAAAHGHVDESMMKKHYAVNNEKRLREELKGVRVDFV
jgi:integrase